MGRGWALTPHRSLVAAVPDLSPRRLRLRARVFAGVTRVFFTSRYKRAERALKGWVKLAPGKSRLPLPREVVAELCERWEASLGLPHGHAVSPYDAALQRVTALEDLMTEMDAERQAALERYDEARGEGDYGASLRALFG